MELYIILSNKIFYKLLEGKNENFSLHVLDFTGVTQSILAFSMHRAPHG